MGLSKFYHCQVEQPHRSSIELRFYVLLSWSMLVISYSYHGILTSTREVLWSLDDRRYLDIAQWTLKVLIGVPRSCLSSLYECPLCDHVNEWVPNLKWLKNSLVKVWRGHMGWFFHVSPRKVLRMTLVREDGWCCRHDL